jgi:hypothetical protein
VRGQLGGLVGCLLAARQLHLLDHLSNRLEHSELFGSTAARVVDHHDAFRFSFAAAS